MSTYSSIIAAVKARVDTVSNVGKTHAYTRVNSNWDAYLDAFKTTVNTIPQIRGWIITINPDKPIQPEPFSLGNTKRTYNVQIFGFLGLADASNTETTFMDLVESILNACDGRTDLGLSAVIDFSVGPSSCQKYEIRQLGSVFCHYAEINVPVEVEVSVSYA